MVSGCLAQSIVTGNNQMICNKCEHFHLWKASFNFMSFIYMNFIILMLNAIISALFTRLGCKFLLLVSKSVRFYSVWYTSAQYNLDVILGWNITTHFLETGSLYKYFMLYKLYFYLNHIWKSCIFIINKIPIKLSFSSVLSTDFLLASTINLHNCKVYHC